MHDICVQCVQILYVIIFDIVYIKQSNVYVVFKGVSENKNETEGSGMLFERPTLISDCGY